MREELSAIWRDLVFGARQFKRSPALTAGIILSLGFGIGASGTVFSWMEGTVLRPLPDCPLLLDPSACHDRPQVPEIQFPIAGVSKSFQPRPGYFAGPTAPLHSTF